MFSIRFLLNLIFILAPSITLAVLSQKAIYARCYAQLVGNPVPLNSPMYALIKEGKKTGLQGCEELINKAKLNSSGDLNLSDNEAALVFNTLHQFHRTWFPTSRMDEILGFQNEFDRNTNESQEFSSPALTLTYSLFAEMPYQNILRGTEGYYAVRANGGDRTEAPISISGLDGGLTAMNLTLPGPASNGGLLTGIRKKQITGIIANYAIPTQTLAVAVEPDRVPASIPYNMYQNQGGGILGQQAFFLLNSGHPKGQVFDGALKLPRKWSKTAMESLMCLTLPSLRETDILEHVVPTSSVPFRRASSCVTCHASMDMMAFTARHLFVGQTGPFNQQKSIFVGTYRTTLESRTDWPSEGDATFRNQRPTGRLIYRSYHDGSLVNLPVSDMEQLGTKMSETQEFYQCAAKRYFEYFTGISVSLYDRTNPLNQSLNKNLTSRDIKDRSFVEALANELKQTQSISKMIIKIMQSSYYRSSSFNPEEKP